jgi:hypothetical protein
VKRVFLLLALLLFSRNFFVPLPARAQTIPPPEAQAGGDHPRAKDRLETQMEQRRLKEANRQRQEQIKRDSDKLLQLATELKTYVDRSNQDILSLEVLRKAEEIEKLAKSVKDKMRNSYGPAK